MHRELCHLAAVCCLIGAYFPKCVRERRHAAEELATAAGREAEGG